MTEIQKATWELIHAQGRMLEKWSEGDDNVQKGLWQDLHKKGEVLRQLLESEPSEQKPHKESKFTLSAAIENLDKLASIGKSLLSEQKPSERAEEISYRAWRTLVNSGWANVQGEILNAMQEYAQQSMKHERDRAIQECIDIVKKCAGFESHHIAASRINSVAAELEKLKSKTI